MPVNIGEGLSFRGHPLTPQQLDLIRQITRDFRQLALTELAHTLCELLEWKRPNGSLKSRECYLFLQALHARGGCPGCRNPGPTRDGHTRPVWRPIAIHNSCAPVRSSHGYRWSWRRSAPTPDESCSSNTSTAIITWAIAFPMARSCDTSSAASRSPVPCWLACCSPAQPGRWRRATTTSAGAIRRGNSICRGWSTTSRFLFLPWVQIPDLASHILSLVASRLRSDWLARYAVEPVLLETLVDRSRYAGTCYRAANWTSVGLTQGRGRMDSARTAQGERKEIFLYPLRRNWRRQLCGEESEPVRE